MNTNQYLNAVKLSRDMKNDAELASRLEITGASISAMRHGKTHMGDSTALKVAELLGIEPYAVLADCHAERNKRTPAGRAWKTAAERLRTEKDDKIRQLLALCKLRSTKKAIIKTMNNVANVLRPFWRNTGNGGRMPAMG